MSLGLSLTIIDDAGFSIADLYIARLCVAICLCYIRSCCTGLPGNRLYWYFRQRSLCRRNGLWWSCVHTAEGPYSNCLPTQCAPTKWVEICSSLNSTCRSDWKESPTFLRLISLIKMIWELVLPMFSLWKSSFGCPGQIGRRWIHICNSRTLEIHRDTVSLVRTFCWITSNLLFWGAHFWKLYLPFFFFFFGTFLDYLLYHSHHIVQRRWTQCKGHKVWIQLMLGWSQKHRCKFLVRVVSHCQEIGVL